MQEKASDVTIPSYWTQAKTELLRRDRILQKLIPTLGNTHLSAEDKPFITLARAIVGQQVSIKSAHAIWEKLTQLFPKWTPTQVLKISTLKLCDCGLSKRKAEYLINLATYFKNKKLQVDQWPTMTDEAVIEDLTQVRGIGRWTAEMFLIFNLLRPDVLPLDDLGLLKSISIHYFSGEPVSRSDAREVSANWKPWRTVATWYLWRSLDPSLVSSNNSHSPTCNSGG